MINYKFGIVTTFYNSSKYVDLIFESILNQTYDNWLYFITDDGSSDDTKEKILKYCDNKRIFYVEQKFKKEMFWQPQRFVTEECDFVVTMDSDDYVFPKALQVYNHMLNVYKDENIVFLSSDSIWHQYDKFDDILNPTYINYCKDINYTIENRSPNTFGSFRCFKNIKNLNFKIDYCNKAHNNDSLHWSSLFDKGSYLYINRSLYNYNFRNDSISHKILSDDQWADLNITNELISENLKNINNIKIVNSKFDNLFTDLNTFLICDINKTNISNLRLNLITKNINKDFDYIKNLYHDHFVDINNFDDDFDFYLVNTSDYNFNDLDQLDRIFKYLSKKKYRQINFYHFDNRNKEELKNNYSKNTEIIKNLTSKYLGGYFWNYYDRHFNVMITNMNYSLNEKTENIINESGSLGDCLAWTPIVNQYAIKNKVKINFYTIHKELFKSRYPLINFLDYSKKDNIKNSDYKILGCFEEKDWKPYSLQEVACRILDLPYSEIKPRLEKNNNSKKHNKKYVCIATQSTSQCKYWNNKKGWNKVVSYLNNLGYDVFCIDRYNCYGIHGHMNSIPSNCIDKTGDIPISERIEDLNNCEFFIGLGSGLSWLAWACNKPVIMISGFSDPKSEFYTKYRVHNKNVCNSCWNDMSIKFDKSNWLWCPRNKNFECSKEITFEMVKEKIDQCIIDINQN